MTDGTASTQNDPPSSGVAPSNGIIATTSTSAEAVDGREQLEAPGQHPTADGRIDGTAAMWGPLPHRQILTKQDLENFHKSEAYEAYVGFIQRLNDAVVGKPLSAPCHVSENVDKMLKIIAEIDKIADDTPPQADHQSRFGNPAFRLFYDRLSESAPLLHVSFVPRENINEISRYLIDSFGNRRRIDYGTGHEANFATWLLCLERVNLIKLEDYETVVLRVFLAYLNLMRKLQFAYWLEPAGSHGVWGLDDYHFLPFMFGSAQLRGHKYIRPKSIHDPDVVEEFSKDYLYLACIRFINSVKTTASLRWHSPMLDDISGVRTWDKVNEGMLKMYKAEVLGKLPIMQHFMFGSLLQFRGCGEGVDIGAGTEPGEEDATGHVHVYAMGQEFPQCCGMKVPSAIGAIMAGKQGQAPRRLPFD